MQKTAHTINKVLIIQKDWEDTQKKTFQSEIYGFAGDLMLEIVHETVYGMLCHIFQQLESLQSFSAQLSLEFIIGSLGINYLELKDLWKCCATFFNLIFFFVAKKLKDQANNILRQLIVERENPKHSRGRFSLRYPVTNVQNAEREGNHFLASTLKLLDWAKEENERTKKRQEAVHKKVAAKNSNQQFKGLKRIFGGDKKTSADQIDDIIRQSVLLNSIFFSSLQCLQNDIKFVLVFIGVSPELKKGDK
ncbi:hypothetical protein RFI_13734 [Reticulomyxa filosa]|uniref:Uncharacterized protein n=1 Tax=Reticulomyxa filosa TaxID=46433 RepID=X6NAZ6_RETFI|nr:hypothetical protein RFI_13734 [Reticulomyxa filosa]|eukprot:ETO23450.1 hypothetical protein RFI_13734 [Reticulomyxa filosa]